MNIIKNNFPAILFFISLLAVFFFLDYQNILFLRPQSLHFIRQTDCLSFVSTYYNLGMDFFEPRMLSLRSVDGKAIGEFPILYYITALLYKLVGEHEFILRLINIIIVSTGLYYTFKLLRVLLSDTYYALFFTFLFFSSTILIYYTNNYLPDASSFGLTMIAWYFYYSYLSVDNKNKYFGIAIFFFTFATLLKITYGLNLAAALLSLVIIEISDNKRLFTKKRIRNFAAFILAAFIIGIWYLYVITYNQENNTQYFLTHITPIWNLTSDNRSMVMDYIYNYWYTKYYYESTLHVFLGLLVGSIFLIKHSNRKLLIIAMSTLLGGIIYFLLFYAQFEAHDYYFITLIPAIILVVVSSFISIRNRFPKIFNSLYVKLAILALMLLSLNYAKEKLEDRYENAYGIFATIGKQLNGADEFLNEQKIGDNSTFIVIGDLTPNGSLYFLNRRGWTFPDLSSMNIMKIKSESLDKADYIVLTSNTMLDNPTIATIPKEKIGIYNNAVFYKLLR